jgi:hypothetical protein
MKKNDAPGTPKHSKLNSNPGAAGKKTNKRLLDEATLDQVQGGTGQVEQQIQDRLKEAQQGMIEGSQYNDIENFKSSGEGVEIDAQGGDDQVVGSDNDDVVLGGEGDDHLRGQEGDDLILGGEGNDHIQGNAGNDTLVGGKGDDALYANRGENTIVYGLGDGRDTVYGNGDDTLVLTIDKENLDGWRIWDNGWQDLADVIDENGSYEPPNGWNYVFAPDGGRVAMLDIGNIQIDPEVEVAAPAPPTILGELPAEVDADAPTGNIIEDAQARLQGDDRVQGTDARDRIRDSHASDDRTYDTGAGNDEISAGIGDDVISGGSGNDWISAGRGDDIIIGGEGDDELRGGDGDDTFIYREGDGSDTIIGGWGSWGENDRLVLEISPGDLDEWKLTERGGWYSQSEVDMKALLNGQTIELDRYDQYTLTAPDGAQIQLSQIDQIVLTKAAPPTYAVTGTMPDPAALRAPSQSATLNQVAEEAEGVNEHDRVDRDGGGQVIGADGGWTSGTDGDDIIVDKDDSQNGWNRSSDLHGGDGDDILDAGADDDGREYLEGGRGADTFIFGENYGRDQMYGDSEDRLLVKATPSDLENWSVTYRDNSSGWWSSQETVSLKDYIEDGLADRANPGYEIQVTGPDGSVATLEGFSEIDFEPPVDSGGNLTIETGEVTPIYLPVPERAAQNGKEVVIVSGLPLGVALQGQVEPPVSAGDGTYMQVVDRYALQSGEIAIAAGRGLVGDFELTVTSVVEETSGNWWDPLPSGEYIENAKSMSVSFEAEPEDLFAADAGGLIHYEQNGEHERLIPLDLAINPVIKDGASVAIENLPAGTFLRNAAGEEFRPNGNGQWEVELSAEKTAGLHLVADGPGNPQSSDLTFTVSGEINGSPYELTQEHEVEFSAISVSESGLTMAYLEGREGDYSISREGNSLMVVPFDGGSALTFDMATIDRLQFADGNFHSASSYQTEIDLDDQVNRAVLESGLGEDEAKDRTIVIVDNVPEGSIVDMGVRLGDRTWAIPLRDLEALTASQSTENDRGIFSSSASASLILDHGNLDAAAGADISIRVAVGTEGQVEALGGFARANGQASAENVVEAKAGARFAIGQDGLRVGANASVGIVATASASGSASIGDVTVEGEVEVEAGARVGAEAEAEATGSKTTVSAAAEARLSAQVSGNVSVSTTYVPSTRASAEGEAGAFVGAGAAGDGGAYYGGDKYGASGEGSASAGAGVTAGGAAAGSAAGLGGGAGASVKAGWVVAAGGGGAATYDDGSIHLGFTGELAAFVGVKIDVHIEIDTKAVEETALLVADGAVELSEAVEKGWLSTADAVDHGLASADEMLDQGIADAEMLFRDGVMSAEEIYENDLMPAADMAKAGIITGAEAVRDFGVEAGDAIEAGILTGVDSVKLGYYTATEAIEKGYATAEQAVRGGILSGVDAVNQGYLSATDALDDGLLSATDAINRGWTDAGTAVNEGWMDASSAVRGGYFTVEEAISGGFMDGAEAVRNGLSDFGTLIDNGLVDAADAIEKGWISTNQAINDFGQSAEKLFDDGIEEAGNFIASTFGGGK